MATYGDGSTVTEKVFPATTFCFFVIIVHTPDNFSGDTEAVDWTLLWPPEGGKLSAEDIWDRCEYVLSVKMREP